MAGNVIKKTDIFESANIFQSTTDGASALNDILAKLTLTIEGMKTKLEDSANTMKKADLTNPKGLREYTSAEQEAIQQKILLEKLQQEQIKTQKLLETQARAAAKGQNDANSAYRQAVLRLSELKKILKDQSIEATLSAKQTKALRDEFTKLDAKVRNAEEGVREFQRSVGSYRVAIKDALADTGLFNGQIFKLLSTLGGLKSAQEAAGGATNTLGSSLKLLAIGGVLAALLALKEGLTLLKDETQVVADGFDKITSAAKSGFVGFLTGGRVGAITAAASMVALKEAVIAYREEHRKLQRELLLSTQDQDDFNRVANDTTIGFKERNAAFEKNIQLSVVNAQKRIEIAQKDFDLAAQTVVQNGLQNGKLGIQNDLLEKQAEAQRTLLSAQDDLQNLDQINGAKTRARALEEAETEINLTLKKREAYNSDKVILENQLANEKTQLEQREVIADKLLAVNRKTTDEEIKIFKEKIGVELDGDKLIAERDSVELKNKIAAIKITKDGVTIGIGASEELAKIVKQAQENEIANEETKRKLGEEEIKRKQKLSEINKEIGLLQAQQRVAGATLLNESASQKYEKDTSDLQKSGGSFSSTKGKQRDEDFNQVISGLLGETNAKKDALQQQADLDKEKAINSINDEKIRAAEIKKIEQRLQDDLINLQLEEAKKEHDLKLKKQEDDKAILNARRQKEISFLEGVTAETANELQKRADLENEARGQQIDAQQKDIANQTALAAAGKANTLANSKADLAKEELAQKDALKRQQQQQEAFKLAEALEAAFANELNAGKSIPEALGAALASTLAIKGLAKTIAGSFYEGTGDNSNVAEALGKPHMAGRDGYLIRADGGEQIARGAQVAAMGGRTMNEIVNTIVALDQGKLLPDYVVNPAFYARADTGENMSASLSLQKLSDIDKGIQDLVDRPQYSIEKDIYENLTLKKKSRGQTIREKKYTNNRTIC